MVWHLRHRGRLSYAQSKTVHGANRPISSSMHRTASLFGRRRSYSHCQRGARSMSHAGKGRACCRNRRGQSPRTVDLLSFEDVHQPDAPDDPPWAELDERSAAGLCYTSGTTGNPKGVLYSHRSNCLHALMSIQPDLFNLRAVDVILPIVPMYHANAWGLAFSAPIVGAKLVLPGPRLDGASLANLIAAERVTFAAGVPTVAMALLDELRKRGTAPVSL